MNNPNNDSAIRVNAYTLMITVAIAAVCGRILSANRVYEPSIHHSDPGKSAAAILMPLGSQHDLETITLLTAGDVAWSKIGPDEPARIWPRVRPEPLPTFSSNDRSRWATIRALVDHGTYVIGRRLPDPDNPPNGYRDRGIISEDGWQSIDVILLPGTNRFYSSKPPLLPTVLAGEYWLLKHGFGWTLTNNPWEVVRAILLTVNALPMLIYLILLARLVERYGATTWGKLFIMAAGCFATLLTPFAITLNNHTIAACSALFSLYPALRIWSGDKSHAGHFVLSGFFAAFTVCNELPAASFAACLLLLLLWRAPKPTLLYFAPAAAVLVAAFLLTNYLAIGKLDPAYSDVAGASYHYAGSYWEIKPGEEKRGIDWAGLTTATRPKESKVTYAFHLLLGHHGLFSLTPIYLLAVAGMITGLGRRRCLDSASTSDRVPLPRMLPSLTLLLTLVVVGFYIYKTDNYGGWTSGPRWLMWLTPLWLLTMLPVVDWLSIRRWGRGLGYLLLAVSVLSVSYPAWNPWRHPWIYNYLEAHGWIRY